MPRNLPVENPKPDAGEFINILMGRAKSSRVPIVEYIIDDMVRKHVVTKLLGRQWVESTGDPEARKADLDNFIQFWLGMGYDFVKFEQSLGFEEKRLMAPDPAPGSNRQRGWADEHQGSVRNWKDFELYPWPRVENMNFFAFEYLNDHLPEGMGLMLSHGGGVFEHLSWIMSLEGLCYALFEAPDLVKAVADRLGELMTGFYKHILDLDRLIAIFPGDDMGFKTSTLIGPDDLRKYVLPWHKRFAAMTHEKGIPYFLHSCGNMEKIMEDLIEDVGIDGKHSFEDTIIPVQDFQARYGARIAVLGGMDVNILSSGSGEQVRKKTRALVEECGGRGRFAIGSGNSIPSYVSADNYLAMIDEALECGKG